MEILCCGLTFSEVRCWFQRWGLQSGGQNRSESFPKLEKERPPTERSGEQGDTGLIEEETDTDRVHCGLCVFLRS